MEQAAKTRAYGVKLVRGPFVKLEPHPQHCEDELALARYVTALRESSPHKLLAADLFSGAGGLSLGLHQAGIVPVLAVDHDVEAIKTHRHHFGGMSVDWDLSDESQIRRVADLVHSLDIEILAGGPPCQPFSKAGRSMIRYMVERGLREPKDERRELWRSFLEVVALARPRAVLMENVPDMALDKEMFILRSAVEQLEQLGYSVSERVVDTFRYGVPQFRQRLILVALRDGLAFEWPAPSTEQVNVGTAINDLPEVKGGFRPDGGADGYLPYTGPRTAFQRRMRAGVESDDAAKVYDHITRPVREDDQLAFASMDPGTKYSELKDKYKRYRDDIFDDKYKRLDEHDLSRTITAHIAKDGYWYIHPRQDRTLTIREAARLQTFPDWYRFSGPPSAAFRQIGNAVPPALAEALGTAIADALGAGISGPAPSTTVSRDVADWFESRADLSVPWLRAETRWQVVAAEHLLDRAGAAECGLAWPSLRRWATPEATLAARDQVLALARALGRDQRGPGLLLLAESWAQRDGVDLHEPGAPGTATEDLAELVVPESAPDTSEPVIVGRGVLRVAARVTGGSEDVKNRLTDGRLAVARLVGGGTHARTAHLGLIEIAAAICRSDAPLCASCPLSQHCASAEQTRKTGRDDTHQPHEGARARAPRRPRVPAPATQRRSRSGL
jgi:DNA (cytosine-5)-methyltransferase 1